ncbi:type I methionyl aminopeptidase [Candidatus Gottesmanbacteria bacterium]|nr:type I methionyl aminopeptidase [Candidatus Gottesmanbacteria bacterium]
MTKTPQELELMREGGKKLGIILQDLLEFLKAGVALLDIDARADRLIVEAGGSASFKTVRGYKWATCLCINDVVVHGVPTEYKLKKGDVCTIDIGMFYKGLHTDTAWTKIVGGQNDAFLRVGETALWKAIDQAKSGNYVGHISRTIEDSIVGAGYSIVKSLVGHGVGKMLHEDPQIPGFLKGSIEETPRLDVGMTIAIEVIYAKGSGQVNYDHPDGWTVATVDRSVSAVFEHTVAISENGPLVLTKVDT